MVGLRVGQAFGVFLLLGLGVSGSSPQVLRHPTTSMCDSGVNSGAPRARERARGRSTIAK